MATASGELTTVVEVEKNAELADQRDAVEDARDERAVKKSEENPSERGEEGTQHESDEGPKIVVGAHEHALQTSFTFYFIRRTSSVRSQESYESSIQSLGSFASVEGFWGIYNHLIRPNDLPSPADYHLFRGNIKPIWEHEANRKGGKWLIRLRKGLASRFWEEMVMGLVGEQFDVGDEICGIVISIRYQEDILAIWNRTATNTLATSKIRDAVKRLLSLPPSTVMEYKTHDTSIKDNSSFRNTELFRPVGGRRPPPPRPADWV